MTHIDLQVEQRFKFLNSSNFIKLYCLFLAGLMMLRNSYPSWRTVWAEDGTIFFAQLQNTTIYEYLTTPYNGQYLLLTRLFFLPMKFLSIEILSYYCSVIALINYFVLLILMTILLRNRIPLINLVLILASIALLPIAGAESLQNINNLPWFWLIGWVLFTYLRSSKLDKINVLYSIFTLVILMSVPAAFFLFLFSLFIRTSLNYWKTFKSDLHFYYIFLACAIGIFQNIYSFKIRVKVPSDIDLTTSLLDAIYRVVLIPGMGNLTVELGKNGLGWQYFFQLVLNACFFIFLLSSIGSLFRERLHGIPRSSILAICISMYMITASGLFVQIKDFTNYYFQFPFAHARYYVTASFAVYLLMFITLNFKSKSILDIVLRRSIIIFCLFVLTINFSNNPSKAGPDYPSQARAAVLGCESGTDSYQRVYVSPFNNEWFFDYLCPEN